MKSMKIALFLGLSRSPCGPTVCLQRTAKADNAQEKHVSLTTLREH